MISSKGRTRPTSTSMLESSYRSWICGSGIPDAEVQVVLDGTIVLLRRHSIHGTICSSCGSDDLDKFRVTGVDKLGLITDVHCLECNGHLSATCRRSNYYFERIKDPSVLARGDHIGWHRPLAYWHHGIVTRQCADRVAVVGYTIHNRDSPCAKVTEEEYSHRSASTLLRGMLYRITHDDCYTNEYTALRAERTIGEEKYDFFEQNCEHSTTWCKTGLHSSDQLESCFTSIGKIALAVALRAVVLAMLWMLQVCHFMQENSTPNDRMWIERAVNIAYLGLLAAVFAGHSLYKGCQKIQTRPAPRRREPHDDCMESCRKDCTNNFFSCCCCNYPGCSRLTCSVCFVACLGCSLVEASCSFCARKLRSCGTPCCGRPVAAATGLVIRVIVLELVAAAGPFIVVWFSDDIVAFFEARNFIVSSNPVVNRAFIVVGAITQAVSLSYPAGVLLSRWAEGMTECCCCPCGHRPGSARYQEEHPCPVHDDIVHIPSPYHYAHMTTIPIESENPCSAAILL